MKRSALIPEVHRAERELLLDLLSGRTPDARFGAGVTRDGFLAVTPETLYPFVSWALRENAARIDAPSDLVEMMATHYRGNLMLHIKRRALLRITVEILDAASIEYLVLKGPAMAWTIYPDPVTRTMTDLDFFVKREQLERASAVLEAAGFRIPRRFYGSPVEPGDAPTLEHPSYPEVVVEIHSLLDSTSDDPAALASTWSAARRVDLGGLVVPVPGPADFFAQVVMHCALHHRFEHSLRSLLDITLLLRHGSGEIDWPAMRDEWRRVGILRWISLTVRLSHLLLGASQPPGFEGDDVPDEALHLAANQLWLKNVQRVPPRILFTLAGEMPAPSHPHLGGSIVPRPAGLEGMRARAYRVWLRMQRGAAAIANGALRPSNVRDAIRLFRERERLLAMMEQRDSHP